MTKLKETYYQARQEDDQHKSIVQKVMQRSRYLLEDYLDLVVSMEHGDSAKSRKKQRNLWCAACGSQYNWRDPNRVLFFQDSADHLRLHLLLPHPPLPLLLILLLLPHQPLTFHSTGEVSARTNHHAHRT